MIDHIGIEVSDLGHSATFYDAVFFAIGVRRMHEGEHAIAYGVLAPTFWIVTRGRPPAPGYGHVAFVLPGASRSTVPTQPDSPTAAATTARPGCGRATARSTTRRICATLTACGSRSSPTRAEAGAPS